jgi:phosphoribosylaminoimidazole carboxylase PurE protein
MTSFAPQSTAGRVAVLMGSDSDLPVMRAALDVLASFGVQAEMEVTSAHRSPDRTREIVRGAAARGVRVFIVGAGGAAHLAGVVAAESTMPVLGVPIASSPLGGLDALLSTVQMPPGVPVATLAIGEGGARNAALLAIQILALSDADLGRRLVEHRARMAGEVEEKSRRARAQVGLGPPSVSEPSR